MKTTFDIHRFGRWCRLGAAGTGLMIAGGCAALFPEGTPDPPGFYSLDNARRAAPAMVRPLPTSAPTLVVSIPRAAAGFDSQHIIYVRRPHKLEYFAHSEWVDTPARMLSPLIVAAAEYSGAFRAVVHAPSAASGELRLDTEVLRLQQEFQDRPSRVRFALRVYFVEEATRRVVATREFEAAVAAPSEDPYGGVVAANQAVRAVLEELAALCVEVADRGRVAPREERQEGR